MSKLGGYWYHEERIIQVHLYHPIISPYEGFDYVVSLHLEML